MTVRIWRVFLLAVGSTILCACASVPPPVQELEAATAALQAARSQSASQHAADQFSMAELKLANAQQLIERGENIAARRALQQVIVDAKLAVAMSELQQRDDEQRDLQAQIDKLQQRIEELQ